MENKIKWDGSQEAFDEIQAQFEKLGDLYVTTSDKGTIEYESNGKTKKLAKGKYFKYETEEVSEVEVVAEVASNPMVNGSGEFVSRRTKVKRAARK
jgi:hypothetical protein